MRTQLKNSQILNIADNTPTMDNLLNCIPVFDAKHERDINFYSNEFGEAAMQAKISNEFRLLF